MNIKEYISRGVVESYVLGLLTAQERFEFEKYCETYPELKAARETFELAIEKQAMENAIASPIELKKKISSQIFEEKKTNLTRVISIESTPSKKFNWAKLAAAAAVILLAGSIWWNMSLKNENNKLRTDLSQIQKDLDSSQQRITEMQSDARIIQKEGMKMVSLGGTANSPRSFATVYWDTTSHDVYLLVNNLPKPATDEQYQLWAILQSNGQLTPIDLGILEMTQKPLQVYRMKNAQAAQAFAITLEKKDGNPAPDLQKIYVMGNL